MPFVPANLRDLLDSPRFSPYSHDERRGEDQQQRSHFDVLAKSISFQIISALAYLHGPPHGIAHRDVKPGNFLLTRTGCVKLIDFGISWKKDVSECMWPEPNGDLCFDVCTGHVFLASSWPQSNISSFRIRSSYRAPELLFGSRDYDPLAIDLWGLGATLAEFFTPLRLLDRWGDSESDSESGSESATEVQPFIIPNKLRSQLGLPGAKWARESLFDASRGSIGLAWSIFKIRGTPNSDMWPVCRLLI